MKSALNLKLSKIIRTYHVNNQPVVEKQIRFCLLKPKELYYSLIKEIHKIFSKYPSLSIPYSSVEGNFIHIFFNTVPMGGGAPDSRFIRVKYDQLKKSDF